MVQAAQPVLTVTLPTLVQAAQPVLTVILPTLVQAVACPARDVGLVPGGHPDPEGAELLCFR